MRLGLALSGGSIRGMSHIGALRALEEEGIKPDMIAGTSAGSIIAALYATGMSVDDIEKNILKHAPGMFDYDIACALASLIRIWLLFKGKPIMEGLIKGDRIEQIMLKFTEQKTIRQTNIPIAITATDINDGSDVIFSSHSLRGSIKYDSIICNNVLLAEAVRASIAIPSLFKPRIISINGKERRLVDGGVVNNLPIDVLKSMGAHKVLGVNLGYCGQKFEHIDNIMEIGSQTVDVMAYHITKLRNRMSNVIELVYNDKSMNIPFNIKRDIVVMNPHIYDVSLLDTERIPECIERGYKAMKEKLPLIRQMLRI